ncbi:hypothetical protein Tco_0264999 [Tanacetum coccineum]
MPLETLRLWNDLSDPCHDTPMVDRIETDGGSHGDYRKHFTLVFGIRKSNAMSRTAYADAGSCGMSRFKKKIRWQNKMFPLNLLQELMIRLYHALKLTIGKSNPTVQLHKKDPKEPQLSDINGHSEEIPLLPSIDCIAKIPAIYLQQFLKTMPYMRRTGFIAVNLMNNGFDLRG